MEDLTLLGIGAKLQKIGEEALKGLFSRFLIPAAHLFGLM
jgi:hypothetical protein